jgi:hypothetical protein
MPEPVEAPKSPVGAESAAELTFGRYVPLACWTIAIVTFLLIALKIAGYGYRPAGDLRRHAAQAFTHRPYTDIVVMRPEYSMDHSPGWDGLLRLLHEKLGFTEDNLVTFSLAGLMLCIFLAPLPWLRRPEAWLAALLAQMVAIPELMVRFTQARPYLLTEALCVAVLMNWSKPESNRPSRKQIVLTVVAIATSTYVHGTWYLWAVPVAAFFLAGWFRAGGWLAACWLVGAVAGGLLTGRPIEFLRQALLLVSTIFREHLPQSQLVGELGPHEGEFETVVLVALVFLWRKQAGRSTSVLFCPPLLAMMGLCWILGFKADRFWADWGIPAVLVWLVLQFQELMTEAWPRTSAKCVLACALLAAPLYLHTTNDRGGRYSRTNDEVFLDGSDPNLKGWLPEDHGIFYTANLAFYYDTFYKNPTAEWRYILGFEPALMPDEDRVIYREIQRSGGAVAEYEPWVHKMRPEDRMAIYSNGQPDLPELEWHYAGGALWIGRPPVKTAR